jgi:hypothetical protein
MTDERTPLSETDMHEARKKFQTFMRMVAAAGKKLAPPDPSKPSFESRNNDYYLETTLKDGRTIKLRTVFHAIEETVKDVYGGVLKCSYHMRDTVDGLNEWMLTQYPHTTVEEIQSYADEKNIPYEEAKKRIALIIAEKEFRIRIEMARFLHEQLEPTLKIILADLVTDASMFGISQYGTKLANPKDINRMSKDYIKLRKRRSNMVEGVGKRGKERVPVDEVLKFMEIVFTKMRELEEADRKITPNAVARKIIGYNHSNPLKAFKGKLNKYDLTFGDLRGEYQRAKNEQKDG